MLHLNPLAVDHLPLAGRLKHCISNWVVISKDPWVLETVQGFHLDLVGTPHQLSVPLTVPHTKENMALIDLEIKQMLDKKAIHVVPPGQLHQGFVSSIFLVPKKGGGQRPVVNLRPLNQFIPYEHFKMEGIHMLRDLLRKGDFMVKIDLKDAYFTVPVWKNHQKFLRFVWKETMYEFACLPFGLASAPRVFTKLMKPVVGLLRQLGIRLIVYLDDMLIMAQSRDIALQHASTALDLLQGLGFMINYLKSVLVPSTRMEFLGFVVDSLTLSLALPRDKIRKVRKECQTLLDSPLVTVRQLAKLLGHLTSTIQAVFPGPLHFRHLQNEKNRALVDSQTYDSATPLSPQAKEELVWWRDNLEAWNGKALVSGSPDLVIETDASRQGWGAFRNGVSTGGQWSQGESLFHINCLELLAGAFAVKTFVKGKVQMRVRLLMDNLTAAHYINKMGGTKSPVLARLALDLWEWCLHHNVLIEAQYLPGVLNVRADRESRVFLDHHDWKLDPLLFAELNQVWGPLEVDLFASRLSTQLPRFYSWRPDPHSEAVDAFSQDWSKVRGYAFPPFALVGRCLRQLLDQNVSHLVLVAPVWQSQPWYPLLLELCVAPPILFPHYQGLLTRQGEVHPLSNLQLAGWLLSANHIQKQASAWRRWDSWCRERKLNSVHASVESILEFLTSEFNLGRAYRTLNVYRSAISSTHPKIDSVRVGEHPLVVQLLKGAYNLRPPLPRYSSTWDVSLVVSFIDGLGVNESLSLKDLSQKLGFLLALTAMERVSEVVSHDLRYRRFIPEGVTFALPDLTKKSRAGQGLKTSFHASFEENPNLCVVKCLKVYEHRTSEFRPLDPSKPNKLLLSYIRPHKPITGASLSRWLKDIISRAGIDTSIFKAHSVRGASASAAYERGASLQDILDIADWSTDSTFRRFYYRPRHNSSITKTLLNVGSLPIQWTWPTLKTHCYMRRLFWSIIADYARAACGLQYKMDYTKIKETNVTMSLPPLPFPRTYPFGSCSYQVLLMFNPLSFLLFAGSLAVPG